MFLDLHSATPQVGEHSQLSTFISLINFKMVLGKSNTLGLKRNLQRVNP